MKEVKVNLGCGKNYIENWVNIDLFSTVKADVYADLCSLPFQQNSIDLLLVSHLLEHTHRHAYLATLTYWRSLLKPGGLLRLAVPDFAAAVKWYNSTGDLTSLIGILYGGQNFPTNSHHIIFDEATLTAALQQVGFTNIERWDWRKTEHAAYDDYSQCYLPHMRKEDGLLMSLNLQATKT